MLKSDLNQILKSTADGRYNEMENMDMMLNYDNNEFMNSDFFDTIRSVESDIQDDFLDIIQCEEGDLKDSERWSSSDGFNVAYSDASSHTEGFISPRNDVSETESSSVFTDESVSPMRSVDVDEFYDLLKPLETNFEIDRTAQPIVITKGKPINIIHNGTNKKIIHKPILNGTPLKKIGKKQILKVQSLNGNGKPVILPYGLKSIKILNASDLKTERIQVTSLPTSSICRRKIENAPRIKEDPDSNVVISSKLTEVKLTSEERRLLDKEGIQLPAYHPLTKMEDRELKRIRRKIRNKISAQDSRKRKKEYVDGLEARVRRGSEENRNLVQRVRELQKKNKTLMAHINKLQSLIFNSTSSKATPSTCLMIVMLSVLLVSLPNMRMPLTRELSTESEQVTVTRTLLSTQKSDDEGINMEEFLFFNKDDESVENETNTDNEILKAIEDLGEKYEGFEKEENGFFTTFLQNVKDLFGKGPKQEMYHQTEYGGGFANKRGFIEPELDEFDANLVESEPPTKKMKLIDDYYHQNDENFVPFNRKLVAATLQVGESKNK